MNFFNTILAILIIFSSSVIYNPVTAKIADVRIPSTKEGSELTILGDNLDSQ